MALIKPEQLRSGSYNITGSLFGTSSYANFALTASFALNGGGGSPFPYTGSAIISGSLVVTGSVASTAGFTGSLQGTATTASYVLNAVSASRSVSSSFATTASVATILQTARTIGGVSFNGSANINLPGVNTAGNQNTSGNASTATNAATATAPLNDWIPAKPDPNGISPYSLGSPTSWWNSLYVNHGTIYFMSQSVGGPTVSSSISVVDDTYGSSFVFGTKNAAGQPTNIIISNEGVSTAISASYALTASFAQNAQTASFFSGSVSNAVSASYALTASFAISSSTSISSSFAVSASWAPTQTINTSSLATTGSNQFNGNQSISGSLTVSQSINSYNINVGTPTSNAWQSSLSGSYFNNFTSQTDTSEILRFIAGLLSSSAPDASPNTKTYSTYTANAVNTTTGTVTAGSIPSGSTNTTITYLQSRGFANSGSTIFASISPIYTLTTYGYTYTSVAAGSTTVSSSADAQLFGLGLLSSGTPTSFKVSGSFTFRFKDNSAKTDTATSSSQALITQTGAGTTSGVSLAKINTTNPAVIPSAYQDGKYAAIFSPSLFNNGASALSSSGYYHISSSIQIASGSSNYTTPIASNAEIFYAPLTTISTNIPSQTPTTGSTTPSTLTAVSRSLSGAPYLSGSTYNVSSSFTNLFNPLYYAGAGIAALSTVSTGITQTSGITTVSTAGGTIQTAGAVFDSTGITVRATSTIPFETDIVKLNGLYTFGSANITNIGQTSFTPTTFTVSIAGVNKAASTSTYSSVSNYHTAGTFGQPVSSGSLAYYTRTQGTDSGTVTNEPFTGESNRIVLNDNILSFTGTAWTTTFGLYTLGATDLQVKPGYLVKPGGTYGYWLANPSSASDYKYYVRKFTTNSTTKTSMTLNAGVALADWQTSGSNAVAALILFKSSNNTIYTPSRFYDPTKTTSNFVGNITANTDGQNPFGSQIALYGNTGGSLASTTYTIPIRNADGMILDSTYNDIYVIIRYKGDPTPITAITIAFS